MAFDWDQSHRLSVIMPAHNEGPMIYSNLHDVRKVLRDEIRNFEIIVVDDGSTDDTAAQISRAREDIPELRPVLLGKNAGKGFALKRGFEAATGDYIFFLDADLDLPPAQMQVLWDAMKRENADVVIGCKRHPQSSVDYPLERRILSAGYFFLVKLMFGLPIRDTQTGIKLFKAEVLKKCFHQVRTNSFAVDLELLALAHYYGYAIAEAPVVVKFQFKMGGVAVRSIWDILFDTIKLYRRLYIQKVYEKPNGKPGAAERAREKY